MKGSPVRVRASALKESLQTAVFRLQVTGIAGRRGNRRGNTGLSGTRRCLSLTDGENSTAAARAGGASSRPTPPAIRGTAGSIPGRRISRSYLYARARAYRHDDADQSRGQALSAPALVENAASQNPPSHGSGTDSNPVWTLLGRGRTAKRIWLSETSQVCREWYLGARDAHPRAHPNNSRVVITGISVMDTASGTDRAFMRGVSDTSTISLDRPRKAILAVLYVVLCFAMFVLGIALAAAALQVISRYG